MLESGFWRWKFHWTHVIDYGVIAPLHIMKIYCYNRTEKKNQKQTKEKIICNYLFNK